MSDIIRTTILSFLLSHGSAGKSVYSFETVEKCGTDPKVAACKLEPACEGKGPLCAAPRWNAFRGAWVQVEDRPTAEKRWEAIVDQLVLTSSRLITCRQADGSVDFNCKPIRWGGGPGQIREMAIYGATVALHESGLREDVQIGAPPMGRGPDGEACLMQIMPDQIAPNAPWLSDEERKAARTRAGQEEIAKQLLGADRASMDRCFEVGLRALARARSQCRGKGVGDAGVFSAYGTGGSCTNATSGWVTSRVKTVSALRAAFNPLRISSAR